MSCQRHQPRLVHKSIDSNVKHVCQFCPSSSLQQEFTLLSRRVPKGAINGWVTLRSRSKLSAAQLWEMLGCQEGLNLKRKAKLSVGRRRKPLQSARIYADILQDKAKGSERQRKRHLDDTELKAVVRMCRNRDAKHVRT